MMLCTFLKFSLGVITTHPFVFVMRTSFQDTSKQIKHYILNLHRAVSDMWMQCNGDMWMQCNGDMWMQCNGDMWMQCNGVFVDI